MEDQKKSSVFTLKLIGSLFSIVSILLCCLSIWLFRDHELSNHADYKSLLVATGTLTAATFTIAIFIWWIVSNKKKFLNFD